jgi:hypothetical protein
MKPEIAAAASWLAEQVERVAFGEVTVTLVLHGGKVSRIERSVTEKSLSEGGTGR